MNKKFIIFLLAIFPFVFNIAMLPLVNKIEPIVLGLPFLQFWLFLGIVLTPICTYGIYRIQKLEGSIE